MFLFGKRQAVLYLRRRAFVLYPLKGASIRFDYPDSAIADLEVIDVKKLDTELASFISENRIKPMRVLIVLSPQAYFQKILQASDEQAIKSEIERFLDEVPFEGGKIVHKVIEVDKVKYIFATNKLLYETIKNSLEGLGFEITAILPLSSYNEFKEAVDRENFDGAELKRMVSKEDAIRERNLLETQVAPLGSPNEIRASFQLNRTLLIGFPLALLLIGSILFFAFSQTRGQKPTSPVNIPQSSPSATIALKEEEKTSTDSAEIANVKETLTISVLNGSNISGMAASVRDSLQTLGFTKIEVGNAKGEAVEEAKVSFAKDVSPTIRDLIIVELEKMFLTVEVKEEEDLDVGIEITTGTELVNP